MSTLSLRSTAFTDGGSIPSEYTCDGNKSLSPPLSISGVPKGTKALVLIMDDPDVPRVLRPSGVFDHWVLYNLAPETREIGEGAVVGSAGRNSAGGDSYTGPCPPAQFEPKEHRYVFTLYALSEPLRFEQAPTKQEVLGALAPLLLGKATLTGRYSRQ